jgi:uncharacterized membrane protein SpoIIM required for sporulation
MTLDRFISTRRASWERLESLLEAAKGRPERLGSDGVRELGRLYRGAAADLALARRSFASDPVRRRLESLVGRAGLIVYEGRPERRSLAGFFATDLWRLIAERPWPLAVAAVALLFPAILAGFWASADPSAAHALIPGDFQAATDPPSDAGASAAQRTVFSVELFTHNIQVTFLAFALGITAGIGTVITVAFNGLLLGAVAGAAIEAGNGSAFFEFVIPHGPLELSCIVVCAAAGIRLGWALVEPGYRTRGQALASEGRRSVQIVLGLMPWLVLAGISEAFVRSAGLPAPLLVVTGLGLFFAFWGLVAWRGFAVGRRAGRAGPVAATPAPAT